MSVDQPLRVDPRLLTICVTNRRVKPMIAEDRFYVVMERNGTVIESGAFESVVDAVHDLVDRVALPWVATLAIHCRGGDRLLGILGDETVCPKCNGHGRFVLFSTSEQCEPCHGRGTLLSVPANLPAEAFRL